MPKNMPNNSLKNGCDIRFYNNKLHNPKVSVVLLDWSCRESFHVLNYLNNQFVGRDNFEIIWIEYYNRVSKEIDEMLRESMAGGGHPILDNWIIMNMPNDVYYHKHLMYNLGIAMARGEIVTIVDSDCMLKPSFISSIIKEFNNNPDIVLHFDEFRNTNRKFYPFNYPVFNEILEDGCINNADGITTGVANRQYDALHLPNYGACFSARRSDLISIGGADEHEDYLGHICGPYEMTFRLVNFGKKEIWSETEFIYHTWHPGTDGENNYMGPHDGFNMSSTALDIISSNAVLPLKMNNIISKIKENSNVGNDKNCIMRDIVNKNYCDTIKKTNNNAFKIATDNFSKLFKYKDFYLYIDDKKFKKIMQAKNAVQLIFSYNDLLIDKSKQGIFKKIKYYYYNNSLLNKISVNLLKAKNLSDLYIYYCKYFLDIILPKYIQNKSLIYIFTDDKLQADIYTFLIKKKKYNYSSNVKIIFIKDLIDIFLKMDEITDKNKKSVIFDIKYLSFKNEEMFIPFKDVDIIFEKVNKNILIPAEDFLEFKYSNRMRWYRFIKMIKIGIKKFIISKK